MDIDMLINRGIGIVDVIPLDKEVVLLKSLFGEICVNTNKFDYEYIYSIIDNLIDYDLIKLNKKYAVE